VWVDQPCPASSANNCPPCSCTCNCH
jgi:hypothetical protein